MGKVYCYPPEPEFRARLRKPRVIIYRVADPGWRFGWNRYGKATIGAGVVFGSRCLSVTWARPEVIR